MTLARTRALSYPRDQSLLISLTHMCACIRGRRGDSSPSLLPPLSPSFLLSCAQDGDLSSSVSFLRHLLSTALPNFSSLCPSLFFLHLVLPLFCILFFFSFSPFAMNFSSTLRKVLMHSWSPPPPSSTRVKGRRFFSPHCILSLSSSNSISAGDENWH